MAVVSERGARLVAVVTALAVHGGAAAVLLKVDPARLAARERTLEVEVVEPPPPPPPAAAELPPPPPPPKPALRRVAIATPTPAPPPPPAAEPPPPNREPPPNTPPAPPVFGVTLNSTVTGDSAMAAPVGNTVATNDRTPAPPGAPARPTASAGPPTFTPVPDVYISEQASPLVDINSADIYPSDAKRMGIEGTVDMRVGVDEHGDVKEVKVVSARPAGYEFDTAAAAAMRRCKFRPARTSDGKAVPSRITYRYRFTLGQ